MGFGYSNEHHETVINTLFDLVTNTSLSVFLVFNFVFNYILVLRSSYRIKNTIKSSI